MGGLTELIAALEKKGPTYRLSLVVGGESKPIKSMEDLEVVQKLAKFIQTRDQVEGMIKEEKVKEN